MATKLPANNKKSHIYNDIITFDTEACTIDENTVITYVWIARINEGCVYGRTPSEFREFMNVLASFNGKFYIWVHNLPYDFVYISDCLHYQGKEFSKGPHRVIKYTYKNVEYRCTYALSNLSLDDLAKKYNLPTQKGVYNYSRIMHYNTPLTDDDINYIVGDVSVVHDYVEMFMHGYDSFKSVELTQTGKLRTRYRQYVHKYAKVNGLRSRINQAMPTLDIYRDLKDITYGAYAHSNRHTVGETQWADSTPLLSADIFSDYPYQMLAHKYPYKFRCLSAEKQNAKHYLANLVDSESMASYATFTFKEIVINEVDCPYIPSHKAQADEIIKDNGKIVYAKNLKIKLTNIDYKIIRELYNFSEEDLIVENIHTASLDYLPYPLIKLIVDLYEQKTMLKGVDERKRDYEQFKELINALFGMNLYDIDKVDVSLTEDGKWSISKRDLNVKLGIEKRKYDNRRYGDDIPDKCEYRLYQWGAWITAYARYDLLVNINKKIGMNNVLYNDTDSVKFICYSEEDYNRIMTILAERDNEVAINLAKMCEEMKKKWNADITLKDLAPRDMLIGTMPIEAEYKAFKALCAKRYLVLEEQIIDNKPYHILTPTVAGVKKNVMRDWLIRDITPDYTTTVDDKTFVHFAQKDLELIFDRFNNELVIPENLSQNKKHIYTPPQSDLLEVTDYLGNKMTLVPTRGVALIPKTFSLKQSDIFADVILHSIQRESLTSNLITLHDKLN